MLDKQAFSSKICIMGMGQHGVNSKVNKLKFDPLISFPKLSFLGNLRYSFKVVLEEVHVCRCQMYHKVYQKCLFMPNIPSNFNVINHCKTTSCKRPSLLSDHFSKIPNSSSQITIVKTSLK